MSRRRRGGGDGGGDAWMNTYADMVTLLLCFFVLLYSMSTIDQQKWSFLLKSLNPEASLDAPVDFEGEFEGMPELEEEDDNEEEEADIGADASPETYDELTELYEKLKSYVEEEGLEASVGLMKGDGLVYLTFSDSIFFDGYSAVLKDEGKVILDVLCDGMGDLNDIIGKVQVLGHTSQDNPDDPNSPREDRYLSSDRANEVLLYMDGKDLIDRKKYIAVGYGQHYPVAPFDTAENRAKNRRVEIIIVQNDDRSDRGIESVYDDLGIGYSG